MIDKDKFKVGDRVRAKVDVDYGDTDNCRAGDVGSVVRCDGDGSPKVNFDGGMSFYIDDTEFELIEPANDELAELRAFKEAAIAKYPDLGPVDPDLLLAREICAKNVDSHNPLMTEPYRNGEYDHHWLMRCVREGIERGRELGRYAQGLTTPKD